MRRMSAGKDAGQSMSACINTAVARQSASWPTVARVGEKAQLSGAGRLEGGDVDRHRRRIALDRGTEVFC
jgi:hypothetical protein